MVRYFNTYCHGVRCYNDIQLTCCCDGYVLVNMKEVGVFRYFDPYCHGMHWCEDIQLACCCYTDVWVNPSSAKATFVQNTRM